MKTYIKPIAVGMIAGVIFLTAQSGIGASIKLNPIKPGTKQVSSLTDEQQAILAVRGVKAVVVSILGVTSTAPSAQAQILPKNSVAGTGFIIDSNGLIVTNNHVVSDASLTYTVTLLGGQQFPASVVGLDKFDDVAILKINATGLATVQLGNSDNLETGQTVFAIGNALGKYQNTVTKGVVSGLGRAITATDENGNPAPRLQNLIQTDAAINPGNSGGPLIDLSGQVVGMNTLIDTGGSGLGFAVPTNVIQTAVQQLKNFGKVSKPYLGISFTTLTQAVKLAQSDGSSKGAYVNSVAVGEPAAAAGLQAGDIIIAINHETLSESNELDTVVGKYPAGTQILVTYMRGSQQMDAPVILREFKSSVPPTVTIQLK